MDTFVLNAIVHELRPQICPSTINGLWQADDFSLVIGLWHHGQEDRLAISIAPQQPYLYLSSAPAPRQVRAFGKFLQYHIKGAELCAISKPILERIVTFELMKRDIDGQPLKFLLILELMGRYSNLILVQQDTATILESLRHVTAGQSSYRRIAPAAEYVPPPKQAKLDPLALDQAAFQQLIAAHHHQTLLEGRKAAPFWKFFLEHVGGFSPLLAKEIAGDDSSEAHLQDRWQRFVTLIEAAKIGCYQPQILLRTAENNLTPGPSPSAREDVLPFGADKYGFPAEIPGNTRCLEDSTTGVDSETHPGCRALTTPGVSLSEKPIPASPFGEGWVGVSAFALRQTACTPCDSMNQAAEQYYQTQVEQQQKGTLRSGLLSAIQARLSKLQKKRGHLVDQQAQSAEADQYKRYGELLTANLYQITKGMERVAVTDYYTDDQALLTIPLDPRLGPNQNAQRYFKRYSKLKQGREITAQRLQDTEQTIAYLEEWQFFVEDADTVQRLQELHAEFQEIFAPHNKPSKAAKSGKAAAAPFLRFMSSDGFEIYVGRSSKENDRLTLRTALPDDIWLHVHNAPGSHVLILNRQRNTPVSEQTIQEAASLAAYYSKSRRAGRADVIYTPRKYVRKPKGSPPGLVTVAQFQTVRVAPQKDIYSSPK